MDRVFYRATLNPLQQVSMLESIFLFPIPRNYSIIHALHPTNEPLTLFQLFSSFFFFSSFNRRPLVSHSLHLRKKGGKREEINRRMESVKRGMCPVINPFLVWILPFNRQYKLTHKLTFINTFKIQIVKNFHPPFHSILLAKKKEKERTC